MYLRFNKFIIFYSFIYFGNFSSSPIIKLTVAFFLFLGILVNQPDARYTKLNWIVATTILLFVISLLRSNNPNESLMSRLFNTSTFLLFIYYIRVIISSHPNLSKDSLRVFYDYILVPYILLVLVNFVFFFFNIGGNIQDRGATSVLLSSFGVSFLRVQFPLTTGINSFAVPTAGIFTAILTMIATKSYAKKLAVYFFAGILLFCLILMDSRMAILLPFLVLLAIYFLYKSKLKFWFYLFIPTSIIGFGLFLLLVSYLATFNLEFFLRSDKELLTLNGRLFIWAYSIVEILSSSMKPLLIGHGAYGHFASGASLDWAYLFESYDSDNRIMHPHNSAISIVFDQGLLGLTFYILLLYYIISSLTKYGYSRNEFAVYGSLLVYILIISVTETYYGSYYKNTIEQFFSLIILLNVSNNVRKADLNLKSIK